MSDMNGRVYQVISPEDGRVVPLTCSQEQLPEWLERGYVLVDAADSIEPETSAPAAKRKGHKSDAAE